MSRKSCGVHLMRSKPDWVPQLICSTLNLSQSKTQVARHVHLCAAADTVSRSQKLVYSTITRLFKCCLCCGLHVYVDTAQTMQFISADTTLDDGFCITQPDLEARCSLRAYMSTNPCLRLLKEARVYGSTIVVSKRTAVGFA